MNYVKKCDQNRADVTDFGYLSRQDRQFHLKRRRRLLLLHFQRHTSHHGLDADFFYQHDALAVKDNGAPE